MKIALKGGAAKELRYGGELIRRAADGFLNMADMWKAAGSPPNKRPAQFMRLPTTLELTRALEESVGLSHTFQTQIGRGKGVLAHPLMAVSYAKYLSAEFHLWANRVVLDRIEESDNPELALRRTYDRVVALWRKQGRSDKWIQHRLATVSVRHKFTDTLKEHGLSEGVEYAACTNAIYKPVLGCTAKEALIQRDLPKSANLRDHLEVCDLAAVALSEASAEELIAELELFGQSECENACRATAGAIARAREDARRVIAESRRHRS